MARHMRHHMMRARGGSTNADEHPETTDEQEREFMKDSKTVGAKRGGHVKRKHGGAVQGKHSEARPDRRARGGATSDMNPESSAGKMSKMPYEAKEAANRTEGAGPDRD